MRISLPKNVKIVCRSTESDKKQLKEENSPAISGPVENSSGKQIDSMGGWFPWPEAEKTPSARYGINNVCNNFFLNHSNKEIFFPFFNFRASRVSSWILYVFCNGIVQLRLLQIWRYVYISLYSVDYESYNKKTFSPL